MDALTEHGLVAEVAEGTYCFKNKIGAAAVKVLWDKLSRFILDSLKQQKGVLVPNLGTFTVGPVVGEVKKKVRPAFALLETRYSGISQERPKYAIGGRCPVVQPSYGLLATAAAVHRGACQRLVLELVQRLGVHILSGRPIAVGFPGLGRLFTNKAGRIQFDFDIMLREYFELERERVIPEMDARDELEAGAGGGEVAQVVKGLQHVHLHNPPAIRSRPATGTSSAAPTSPSAKAKRNAHAPYKGGLLDLWRLCKSNDRINSGCVPRLQLEQWLHKECAGVLQQVAAATVLDLLTTNTYGKTGKHILYKPFLDQLEAAVGNISPRAAQSPRRVVEVRIDSPTSASQRFAQQGGGDGEREVVEVTFSPAGHGQHASQRQHPFEVQAGPQPSGAAQGHFAQQQQSTPREQYTPHGQYTPQGPYAQQQGQYTPHGQYTAHDQYGQQGHHMPQGQWQRVQYGQHGQQGHFEQQGQQQHYGQPPQSAPPAQYGQYQAQTPYTPQGPYTPYSQGPAQGVQPYPGYGSAQAPPASAPRQHQSAQPHPHRGVHPPPALVLPQTPAPGIAGQHDWRGGGPGGQQGTSADGVTPLHYFQNQLSPRSRREYDNFNRMHFKELEQARGQNYKNRAVTPKVGEDELNRREYMAMRQAGDTLSPAQVLGLQNDPPYSRDKPQPIVSAPRQRGSPGPKAQIMTLAHDSPSPSSRPVPGLPSHYQQHVTSTPGTAAPTPALQRPQSARQLTPPAPAQEESPPISQYDIINEPDPAKRQRLRSELANALQRNWSEQIREKEMVLEEIAEAQSQWPYVPTRQPNDKRPPSAVSRPPSTAWREH